MSISLLKTLIAISDHGSFRAAADIVNVTHAAIGQQMKRLEEAMGVTLFDRTDKSPRLNQLGTALVPKARELVFAYETILDDLTGHPSSIRDLSLGAVPSSLLGLVPKSIKRLMTLFPQLHIRVVPDQSPDLLVKIEQGLIDFAVMSEPPRIQSNLNWFPICQEQLVLLTSAEVTEDNPIKILKEMPYIRLTRKAPVGMLAEEWLSKTKIQVNDSMELGSLENLANMVAHNLGVSIGPNVCVPDPIFDQLRKISLGHKSPFRTLGILTRNDCSKLQLVQPLLEQIKFTIETANAQSKD